MIRSPEVGGPKISKTYFFWPADPNHLLQIRGGVSVRIRSFVTRAGRQEGDTLGGPHLVWALGDGCSLFSVSCIKFYSRPCAGHRLAGVRRVGLPRQPGSDEMGVTVVCVHVKLPAVPPFLPRRPPLRPSGPLGTTATPHLPTCFTHVVPHICCSISHLFLHPGHGRGRSTPPYVASCEDGHARPCHISSFSWLSPN